MRNSVFFLFLIGCNLCLLAQEKERIRFGLDFGSNITRNEFGIPSQSIQLPAYSYSVREKFSFTSGIIIKYKISDRFNINSGVSLLSRFLDVYGFTVLDVIEDNFVYKIIEIPLCAEKIIKVNSNLNCLINGGISFSFLSSPTRMVIADGMGHIDSYGLRVFDESYAFNLVGPNSPVLSCIGGISFNNKLNRFGSINYGLLASFQTQKYFYYSEYHYNKDFGKDPLVTSLDRAPFSLSYIKMHISYIFPEFIFHKSRKNQY